ncbi:pyridoxal phosphate-dependent transferase [Leucosporidium creatinivorum]|uniref:sphinganine-1-phosphate aldolase n=1 Tax=Leucosporidium creatinivorum TaxID=106004 RepID=A0A1Y2FZJ0_9BASI|nr:pyridoxal phosphate-dependent transferase [Leucosporidium creatinivorum]
MAAATTRKPTLVQSVIAQLTVEHAKTAVFWYVVYYRALALWRHVRARGISASVSGLYLALVKRVFAVVLLIPSARRKVKAELDTVTLDLETKLAPPHPSLPRALTLPAEGLSSEALSEALTALSAMPNTQWEDGRVSGAVYHGGEEMGKVWTEAMSKFIVSNPLHCDVFPGVRKMDSEVVSMCLSLFNSPLPTSAIDEAGGAGTTTSGGTESILMACKAYRDRARIERGITEPEMIVPLSAHAAFEKASQYFKMKIHFIPVDRETRKVNLKLVKRAINPNTIMLVGSAPNFPDGAIDDIAGLSKLALKYNLALHVDCCLGSFLVPFLEKAGYPSDPFDFRVPGVTSISCDTHKYGFAPKGSSVIMYRSKALRKYQYSVTTTWPGGVYATPSIAGSRPGAVIAGAWASMHKMGVDGYTSSCREIVGAAKQIVLGIRKDFPELKVLGDPLVSVVAFESVDEEVPVYEVGDKMGGLGWHLNALQSPPALHIACTRLTVPVVSDFLRDLRIAVDEVKASTEKGKGSMVMLYGLGSSSAVGPGLVEQLASRYMDVLYA